VKLQDILVLAGVGVGGYFAWNWYQNQQAAASAASGSSATTAAQPVTSGGTQAQLPDQSGGTAAQQPQGGGYYTTYGQGPGGGYSGYEGDPIMSQGVSPGGGQFIPPPPHPMAFAKWYASRPAWQKAHLATLSMPQKQAAYHAYVASFADHLAYG
jgi:hypothetical protein